MGGTVFSIRGLFAGLLCAAAMLIGAGTDKAEAAAGLQFCNHTTYVVRSAIALPETDGWLVRGWVQLRPGECRPVLKRLPASPSFYVYAESSTAHQGEVQRWVGSRPFCIGLEDFEFSGPANCAEGGGQMRLFARMEITADATEWTHRFREPSSRPLTLRKARVGGIQRLLRQAGYYTGSIDGYLGRRTKRSITKAKKDLLVEESGFESSQLLDSLLSTVIGSQQDLGFRLCNQTPYEVWSAVAFGPDDSWRSRGWWSLDPQACVQVLKDELPDQFIYIYGEAVSQEGWRITWDGEHPFCISDVKFEIEGSDQCTQRGFQNAQFQRVDTEGKGGWELYFREEDATIAPKSETP